MPTAAMLAGQPGSVLSRIKPLVGLVSWMKYSKESCCISVSSSNEAASTVAGGRCTYGMVVIAGTANTKVPWCHGRPCPYVPHRTHGTCGNLHFAALFAELLVNFSAFLRGSCGDSRHLPVENRARRARAGSGAALQTPPLDQDRGGGDRHRRRRQGRHGPVRRQDQRGNRDRGADLSGAELHPAQRHRLVVAQRKAA